MWCDVAERISGKKTNTNKTKIRKTKLKEIKKKKTNFFPSPVRIQNEFPISEDIGPHAGITS
jgi:hypothetical protein